MTNKHRGGGEDMARATAHDDCLHESTRTARAKCRSVKARVASFTRLSHTQLQEMLDAGKDVTVAGWRIEYHESGPALVECVGTLDHKYLHPEGGWPVYVITSDERPKGTGHLAAFIRLVEES